MRLLSALDASFIYLESDHSPMHIGGVYLMDSAHAPASFGYRAFYQHIQSRLKCSPIFRQRLVEVPLGLSHPYWVNDSGFELEQHLPWVELQRPGGMEELMQLAAHVFGQALNRDRPLWEMTFVSGLDAVPGLTSGSFALISKVHHAAVDGGSGVELMAALLDPTVQPRTIPGADDWQAESSRQTVQALTSAYSGSARKSARLGRLVGDMAGGAVRAWAASKISKIDPPPRLLSAPDSLLNQAVTSSRTYAAVDFDFERIRAVRRKVKSLAARLPQPGENPAAIRALGHATINDVVLALCAGGLRAYLDGRGALPGKPLVAMAPVSVRQDDQQAAMGNQLSAMLVNLATHTADPLTRLMKICTSTQSSKAYKQALPANRIASAVPSETLAAAARLYTRTRLGGRHRPFFNLIITNVPGPRQHQYLAGARLEKTFGMAPIMDGLGLIIVVLSYAGRLSLGLTSCHRVIPDIRQLAALLEHSLLELETAVEQASTGRVLLVVDSTGEDAPSGTDDQLNPAERLRAASEALEQAMKHMNRGRRGDKKDS